MKVEQMAAMERAAQRPLAREASAAGTLNADDDDYNWPSKHESFFTRNFQTREGLLNKVPSTILDLGYWRYLPPREQEALSWALHKAALLSQSGKEATSCDLSQRVHRTHVSQGTPTR